MNKIVEYFILTETKNEQLYEMVEHFLKLDKGWQPYFGPYLDRNGKERQAMVKYEEAEVSPRLHDKITPEVKPESKPKKGKAKDED